MVKRIAQSFRINFWFITLPWFVGQPTMHSPNPAHTLPIQFPKFTNCISRFPLLRFRYLDYATINQIIFAKSHYSVICNCFLGSFLLDLLIALLLFRSNGRNIYQKRTTESNQTKQPALLKKSRTAQQISLGMTRVT